MTFTTLLAIAASALCLFALCWGDPKRRRTARIKNPGQGKRTRRLLGVAACVPGILFAMAGDAAAFLIWLGGCAVVGWFIALGFNRKREEAGP